MYERYNALGWWFYIAFSKIACAIKLTDMECADNYRGGYEFGAMPVQFRWLYWLRRALTDSSWAWIADCHPWAYPSPPIPHVKL